MITWHEEIPSDFTHPCVNRIFTEKALFFDIETTGLSPANASVYLIGTAARRGDVIVLDQFFAESPGEERVVVRAFFHLLKGYETVITYNGDRFDIPFLKAKYASDGAEALFSDLVSLDIRKEASRVKGLLHLADLKQKSVEAFVGVGRDDLFSGGELIPVYEEYLKGAGQKALHCLKLHNYEDVLHMPALLPVLSFCRMIDGGFSVVSLEGNEYTSFNGGRAKELFFALKLSEPVCGRISSNSGPFYLTARGETARLRADLYEGELKYFFEDYKDYFYLPDEDIAVHKSVSAYVDKAHRRKARPADCYTKREGIFLPQYEIIQEPAFYENYKDKKSYFELTEDFAESEPLLKRYIVHALRILGRSG